MQLLTLRDNTEHLESFANKVKFNLYEKILEVIEGEEEYSNLLECIKIVFIYVGTISIPKDFIEILYSDYLKKSFTSLKSHIKEQLNNHISFDESKDYEFYEINKICMEGIYLNYYGTSKKNIRFYYGWEEGPLPQIELKWSETYRELNSVIFNNKIYTYNLFYEKEHVVGSLHFWRLNEENRWERMSFVNNDAYELDILNPEFIFMYFYIWTADEPGDITKDSVGYIGGKYKF